MKKEADDSIKYKYESLLWMTFTGRTWRTTIQHHSEWRPAPLMGYQDTGAWLVVSAFLSDRGSRGPGALSRMLDHIDFFRNKIKGLKFSSTEGSTEVMRSWCSLRNELEDF